MTDEYFDVLDEDGRKTGRTKLRAEVHRDGDWHRAVFVWIVNREGDILLQRRAADKDSYPGLLDVSVGGHLQAGDEPLEAAIREVKEEIGLDFSPSDFCPFFECKVSVSLRPDNINNEFRKAYITHTDKTIADMTMQVEEVSELKFVPFAEFKRMVETQDPDLVPHPEDYAALLKLLDGTNGELLEECRNPQCNLSIVPPPRLHCGDTVAIVSLSSGVLGEDFVKHEIRLLEARLKSVFGLKFKYMDNALKGEKYLSEHPEAKADDLRQAFLDQDVKMIWTAIGGDDTFRTLPYLLNEDFGQIIRRNPKIFMGFSDTTNNHFLLHKLGLSTYYGPALLTDVAELGPEIPPYTVEWINYLFSDNSEIEITPSPIWYLPRTDFGVEQLGIPQTECAEEHGHEYLLGAGDVRGKLFGGCLDSIYEMIVGGRYDDQAQIFRQYSILPSAEDLEGKILFLETSEETPSPQRYQMMLDVLDQNSFFEHLSGLLIGKPQGEKYYAEYKRAVVKIAEKYNLPTVFNLNFGHNAPRMILPYDAPVTIDFTNRRIVLTNGMNFGGGVF